MHLRQPLLSIGHLFLALAFLFTPIVDNMHAIKMLGSVPADLQSNVASIQPVPSITSLAPCHEAMLVSSETALPGALSASDTDNRQPCCPYDECSPDNCLMHMAMASVSTFEMLPHSLLDQRTFLLTDTYPVPMPFTERLRPPIA